MDRRLIAALVFTIGMSLASLVVGQEGPTSELVVANARIVQLEVQLHQALRQSLICQAQLAVATEPSQAKAEKERLEEVGKLLHCAGGVDWTAVPPRCQQGRENDR